MTNLRLGFRPSAVLLFTKASWLSPLFFAFQYLPKSRKPTWNSKTVANPLNQFGWITRQLPILTKGQTTRLKWYGPMDEITKFNSSLWWSSCLICTYKIFFPLTFVKNVSHFCFLSVDQIMKSSADCKAKPIQPWFWYFLHLCQNEAVTFIFQLYDKIE